MQHPYEYPYEYPYIPSCSRGSTGSTVCHLTDCRTEAEDEPMESDGAVKGSRSSSPWVKRQGTVYVNSHLVTSHVDAHTASGMRHVHE